MEDIRALLGDDLVRRPRHGRIRLRGRWIHFPLDPLDLALRLPPSFVGGAVADLLLGAFRWRCKSARAETFASVLEAGLGSTICREFYFPYSRKIWGLPPEQLSATQARRRVSADSLSKMLRKVLRAVPGVKKAGSGFFYYPKGGFGQITDSLYRSAVGDGVEFHLGARLESIEATSGGGSCVRFESDGEVVERRADEIWSTISISDLIGLLKPAAPSPVLEASERIEYRSLILAYLVLRQGRFSEFDAHYFPELHIPIARLSEPKNYGNVQSPADRTVLCAELPCSTSDPIWSMSEGELGSSICDWLQSASIPVRAPIEKVVVRRMDRAYPVYRRGHDEYFDRVDGWLGRMENLISFGRHGLFVHDNIHHALHMAYAAVKCLNDDGGFDRARWSAFRAVFETHVVED
jgi:protoporphyrinogen oxidase